MFKKLNLATKLSIILGALVFIGVIFIGGITLDNVKKSSYKQASEQAKQVSSAFANDIGGNLKVTQATIEGVRGAVIFGKNSNSLNRENIIEILKKTLEKNKSIKAIYSIWEPNAFDNKDSSYINKEGSNENGRFMPYITRDDKSLKVDICNDCEQNDEGDYYLLPKKTKKSCLIEPYMEKVNGKDVLLTSLSIPIFDENQNFIGTVGADIDLQDFQDTTSKAKPMGGYASIVTDKGTIVTHGSKLDFITKNLVDLDKGEKGFIEKIAEGKTFSTYEKSAATGIVSLKSCSTISLPGVDSKWSFISVITDEQMYAEYNALFKIIMIMNVIITLVVITLIFILVRRIIKPITLACDHLELLSEADFTKDVSDKFLNNHSEIGRLAKSIDKMQRSIKDLVLGVKEEASNMEDAVLKTVAHIQELNSNIEDVAATTEELSASMEETAASTQEMSATSNEIENSVELITHKAKDGTQSAKEIDERAEILRVNFIEAEGKGFKIYEETKARLQRALEESKSVDQITSLSNTIMEITEQTNLLALNAAIEAARAGESGRGFAVVAEEIRKLAEDSKDAVSKIQKITETVIESVKNLADSANGMLDHMTNNVSKDYEDMLEATNKYSKDADFVNNMVSEFDGAANEIFNSIKNMVSVIDNITAAANEGANGTTNIAEKATLVAEKSHEAKELSEYVKERNEKLVELVSKFKV